MQIKKIIENGQLVTVKLYEDNEKVSGSELLVKEWFDEEDKKGYKFFKAFKENGKVQTLFIKSEDLDRLLK